MSKLVLPAQNHQSAFLTYLDQWEEEPLIPSACAVGRQDYTAFLDQIKQEQDPEQCPAGLVPATLYFWMDDAETVIYGTLHFRHFLNEGLRHYAGHIGYGVSPSCRGQGIAVKMVQAVFPIAKSMGLERLLFGCHSENLASAKTIERCGGVLEEEWVEDGHLLRRYWVDLP